MIEQVTAWSSVESPVSVADAKSHLRVTFDTDDALIADYIELAQRTIIDESESALTQITYRAHLRRWPCGTEIELPFPPLASVTHVKYYAPGDASMTTMPASDYTVESHRQVGALVLAPTASWPEVDTDRTRPIEIEFVAGEAAASLSAIKRQAVLLMVAHAYELRQPVLPGVSVSEVPRTLEAMINRFRIYDVPRFD